ncbi:MAG: zinc-ribbon domain containing protein [Candidatus Gracilibacteria bacterium]
MEKITKTSSCANCGQSFVITDWDDAFYKKINIVAPTFCPNCRQQRRLAVSNEMNLYHRKCDYSGEEILSVYSPDKPYKVYKPEIWWSDKFEALDYGRDFDFNRPFFEQFDELLHATPHVAVLNDYLLDQNSDYTNYAGNNKNCYLIFHADYNEDCYYGYGVKKSKNCIDVFNAFDSELCYECIDIQNCYNLKYSQNCINCYDGYFLKDCIGCKNCICCKNLTQKEYCIFNKSMSKGDYESFLKENPPHLWSTIEKLKEEFKVFCLELPNRCLRMIQTENSFGDQLVNCKDTSWSFDVSNMHDGKYCYQIYNGSKDCMDFYQFGLNAELIYECNCVGYNCQRMLFCVKSHEQISDVFYSNECYKSDHLFGCTGVRHKKYCILNKQYSRDEYEKLLPRIVDHMKKTGEWGEFFPISISPFGYNETPAQDYFPLTKEEALLKNYKWKDDEPSNAYIGPMRELPDSAHDTSEDICKQILTCKDSGKPYKIAPQELFFYKRLGIPIPRCSFKQRHKNRMALRNPRYLWARSCGKCGAPIQTTYAPDRTEIVYCEECYLKTVY